ncbi:hypothetical protein [Enterococcus sp. DIV0970a]|uniref:hypothetical protein n=1 Tax=unclassified Enterococcus TaxID=2608891 RepID=UPI003F2578F6
MEWWNLWVPFLGTLITLIVNVILNKKQAKDNEKMNLAQKENEKNMLVQKNDFEKIMVKQKIDADLKAKARIEWISQVRELVSTYISELSKLELILEKMIKSAALMNASDLGLNPPDNPSDLSIFFDENVVLIKQSRISINEYSEKVLLYFSEKEEHQEIEDAVTMIPKSLGNFETLVDNNFPVQLKIKILLDTQNDLKGNIAEIRSIFRKYLKIEWDKAKEGK